MEPEELAEAMSLAIASEKLRRELAAVLLANVDYTRTLPAEDLVQIFCLAVEEVPLDDEN